MPAYSEVSLSFIPANREADCLSEQHQIEFDFIHSALCSNGAHVRPRNIKVNGEVNLMGEYWMLLEQVDRVAVSKVMVQWIERCQGRKAIVRVREVEVLVNTLADVERIAERLVKLQSTLNRRKSSHQRTVENGR